MSFILNSQAGRMVVEQAGTFRFEHGGRTVLLSHIVPAYGESYGMELPVTGMPHVEERDGGLLLHYVTQPGNSELTIEAEVTDVGFRLLLAAPASLPATGLAFALEPGGPWYGLGERVYQTWPLDKGQILSDPLMPTDHGRDGTLPITTPLLLGAAGVGLLAEETAGELALALNRGGDGLLRLVVRAPQSPMGAGIDGPIERQGPRLAINVPLADTIKGVFRLALDYLGHPSSMPPVEMWSTPIWTTWARYKMGIDEAQVLQFADEIVANGYPHSTLEIDDRWQLAYGDLFFDPRKFPDPRSMVDRLHEQGFRVTLWIPPFFDPQGSSFVEAQARGYLVRHPATGEPYLTRWWQGFGGLLDVSNADAMEWWQSGLTRLQTEYGIDGFKFDGGESNFVPPEGVTAGLINQRQYPDRYVNWVAQHFQWTEVRTAWRSQRHGLLFRQWDKWSHWGLDNGLHSVLTQALTLSMIGYPFILPDIIGGNAYGGEAPDRELLIRWTQLSALLPAMQFSIAPWGYDEETNAICRRWASIHAELAPYIQALMDTTIHDGTPVVRPMFWHAPEEPAAYTIDDQFMLGDLLVVAPVVQPGITARDVYLPSGRWRDRWNGQTYEGPQHITNYPAPLDTMPVFERIDLTRERS